MSAPRRYIEISGGGLASLICLPEQVDQYIFDFVAEPDEEVALRSIYLTQEESILSENGMASASLRNSICMSLYWPINQWHYQMLTWLNEQRERFCNGPRP